MCARRRDGVAAGCLGQGTRMCCLRMLTGMGVVSLLNMLF